MINNIWNNIKEWFSNIQDRNKLVRDFNNSAKQAFISGVAPTLLKAKFSKGYAPYKHSFSHWHSSGFRIEVFSGKQLSKDELKIISTVVLNDAVLVRRLVVFGFDTLEIHCDQGNYGCRVQLKSYIEIEG